MKNGNQPFNIRIMPRLSMTWEEFTSLAPRNSIALDGAVLGGPRFDPVTNHINFDHHDGVVREATMSTAMQVMFAIKGGLAALFLGNPDQPASIYMNDTDQDTSFAAWLLLNYKLFERTQSIPNINRLLALTNYWDITGGAYPINLGEELVKQHSWVFRPYTDLRKSGMLAQANAAVMMDNLEAVMGRLSKFMMGQAEEVTLDTRHEILYNSPSFKIVNEVGGNEARYFLFNQGMDAFISLVTTRPDGKFVYSVGRRSQYIRFPVETLYDDFNKAEGRDSKNGWGGSTIVGGSSRQNGSSLSWKELRDITNARLRTEGVIP